MSSRLICDQCSSHTWLSDKSGREIQTRRPHLLAHRTFECIAAFIAYRCVFHARSAWETIHDQYIQPPPACVPWLYSTAFLLRRNRITRDRITQ